MPSSQHRQLTTIVDLILMVNPQSLLDVGIGFGKYGYLAREYLEYQDEQKQYREWSNQWTRHIDGIEAFEAYVNPAQQYIYDNVFTGNALDIMPALTIKYDLILLIDVLEHFTHEDGLRLLNLCTQRGRSMLVSVPKRWWRQQRQYGNDYETHQFHWKKKHFQPFKNKWFVRNPDSTICLISDDCDVLLARHRRRAIGRLLERLRVKDPHKPSPWRRWLKQ